MSQQKIGIVYFFKHKGINAIKIGFSASEDLLNRFNQFKTYSPYGAEFLGFIKCINPNQLERKLHRKYSAYRLEGEWFNITIDVLEKESNFIKGRPSMVVKSPISRCDKAVLSFLQEKNIIHYKVNRKQIKDEFNSKFPLHYVTPQQFYYNVRLFCEENNIQCIERKVNGLTIFDLKKII